jgi:hypothetical protein
MSTTMSNYMHLVTLYEDNILPIFQDKFLYSLPIVLWTFGTVLYNSKLKPQKQCLSWHTTCLYSRLNVQFHQIKNLFRVY